MSTTYFAPGAQKPASLARALNERLQQGGRRRGKAPREAVKTHVAIDTREKRSFAAACLMEMGAREGRDKLWLLRVARTVDVPVEVVAVVRARLADKHNRDNADE